MSKRVILSDEDIALLIKLLADVNKSNGFPYMATMQRVNEIKKKLGYGEAQV